MPNAIDCTLMSHPACIEPEPPAEPSSSARPTDAAPSQKEGPFFASYDCINQCMSSQGVASLVEGAVAGLGCIALPPACPAFLVAVPLTIAGACDAACRELERK
jgi:hypothetical protein